jgi:hypothetical protein
VQSQNNTFMYINKRKLTIMVERSHLQWFQWAFLCQFNVDSKYQTHLQRQNIETLLFPLNQILISVSKQQQNLWPWQRRKSNTIEKKGALLPKNHSNHNKQYWKPQETTFIYCHKEIAQIFLAIVSHNDKTLNCMS